MVGGLAWDLLISGPLDTHVGGLESRGTIVFFWLKLPYSNFSISKMSNLSGLESESESEYVFTDGSESSAEEFSLRRFLPVEGLKSESEEVSGLVSTDESGSPVELSGTKFSFSNSMRPLKSFLFSFIFLPAVFFTLNDRLYSSMFCLF